MTSLKFTFLGTGCPNLSMDRFGTAMLLEVQNKKILFDAGRGAALRLHQLGILPGEIHHLFLTHLHSDHLVGLPDIWISGVIPTLGKRKENFKVWGPVGTKNLCSSLEQAFSADIKAREKHGTIYKSGAQFKVTEFEEGIIYHEDGLIITAFLVDHGDMEPCYGFKIEFNNKSIVLSGDTKYNENLIKHAKGADVLIHEVAVANEQTLDKNMVDNIMKIHTTPEQAGEIFNLTKPKLALYNHIVLLGGITEGEANIIERTKKVYDGEVKLSEDLMSISISDEEISIETNKFSYIS